jgi:hypothetical protein
MRTETALEFKEYVENTAMDGMKSTKEDEV